MRYPLLLILFLLMSCTCSAQPQENATILQKALNIPAAKKYFHPKLKSRNPYYLASNRYVDKDYKLTIYKIPVSIKNKQEIPNENYVEITKFIRINSKITLNYYYKVENIGISVTFKKIGDGWQIKTYQIAQF